MNLSEKDAKQALKAGNAAGEYLDRIKIYDVRTLSKAQWNEFINIICIEFALPF